METYLALTKTKRIRSAVVGSGLTDLICTLKTRPEIKGVYKNLIPKYVPGNYAVLKNALPCTFQS